MKIAVPKENREGETRVAASPDVVKKFVSMGFDFLIEKDAGLNAGFTNKSYEDVGATITQDTNSTLGAGDIIFKIQRLMTAEDSVDELSMCKENSVVIRDKH